MAKAVTSEVLQRRYMPDQLREIWDFCQHDFERFIGLLEWLDTLK